MKKYDEQMIRDFLQQLAWEYRVKKFENVHVGALNDELVEQRATLMKRRRNTGLVPATCLERGDTTQAEYAQAVAKFAQVNVAYCDGVLSALDFISRAVDKAFHELRHGMTEDVYDARDVLGWSAKGPSDPV